MFVAGNGGLGCTNRTQQAAVRYGTVFLSSLVVLYGVVYVNLAGVGHRGRRLVGLVSLSTSASTRRVQVADVYTGIQQQHNSPQSVYEVQQY